MMYWSLLSMQVLMRFILLANSMVLEHTPRISQWKRLKRQWNMLT